MRKTLKILHTVSACGLVGGLFAYMVLLVAAPQGSPETYADLRVSIAALSNWILMPSLAVALVSGLLSMAVHRPFLDKRWVWFKAALGILMFKSVLTVVGAKADYAAVLAQRIVEGTADAAALETALAYEWWTLWTILALSVLNIVLGVWRPRLARKGAATGTATALRSAAARTAPPPPRTSAQAGSARAQPARPAA